MNDASGDNTGNNDGSGQVLNGDIEAQAVNVTSIQQEENCDLDGIMLDIIPGIFQVQSAYRIDEVNINSQKVIRYAIWLCCFNVVVAILVTAVESGDLSVMTDAVVSIVFNVLVLMMAVRCVRSKNAICCCGMGSLSFYRYFLMINLFFICIALIVAITLVSYGDLWRILGIIYNSVLFFFNCNQLRYSNKIMKALNVQIQPVSSSSSGRGAQNVPAAVSVVQSTPTYAHAEIDNSPQTNN